MFEGIAEANIQSFFSLSKVVDSRLQFLLVFCGVTWRAVRPGQHVQKAANLKAALCRRTFFLSKLD